MYQVDLAVELLGRRTAAILRVIGLFPNGAEVDFVTSVVGGKASKARRTMIKLINAGVLRTHEDGRLKLNSKSVYWESIVLLLDHRVNLMRLLSAVAADLGGAGTTVALYGAPRTESTLYEMDKDVVFIRPVSRADRRISLWEEVFDVLPITGSGVFLDLERDDHLQKVLDSGAPDLLRSWLRGDDIRPELGTGTILLAVERDVAISQLRRRVPDDFSPSPG